MAIDLFPRNGRYLGDRIGLHRTPPSRDGGEGARHVDQPHVGRAQHHRRQGVDRGGDAEAAGHRRHRAEANFIAELRRDGVLRIGEGRAHVDLAGVGAARIARAPAIDRHRFVHHPVVGGVAGLQRGKIDEQLPGRAGLPHGIDRAVIVGRHIIRAADQGEHRPVAIEADKRALGPARRVALDRGCGGGLLRRIERGPDLQRLVGFGQQQVELGQHPVGEIARRILALLRLELDRRNIHAGGFLGRDDAVFAHLADHHIGAAHRRLDIGGRRIARGSLDQACDDRRLAQRKVARRMAEELAAGGIDAVGAASEIDLVQVELEDLLLGEFPLERHRQHGLARLAVERAVRIEEDVAGQLLRDGGSRLCTLVIAEGYPDGAQQPDRVHAEMRIEAAILHRDHRILHHPGDFRGGEPLAVARPQRHDLAAVARAHHDGPPRLAGLQRLVAGQAAHGDINRGAQRDRAQQRKCDAPDEQALGPAAQPALRLAPRFARIG